MERSGHAQNRIDAAGRLDPLEATVRCGAMRCGVWRVNQLLYKDGSEDALHCTALMLLPFLMRRARSRKEKKRKRGMKKKNLGNEIGSSTASAAAVPCRRRQNRRSKRRWPQLDLAIKCDAVQ